MNKNFRQLVVKHLTNYFVSCFYDYFCGSDTIQKSLENQLAEIGKYQKDKGLSTEFINMFNKLLDYYSKYQNNYVKHNDAVKHSEIDFVIHLTTLFMRSIM